MKKSILFIADFFSDEVLGGGEFCNKEIIDFLVKRQFDVKQIKSKNVSLEIIKQNFNSFIFVRKFCSTFIRDKNRIKNSDGYTYAIIEHDWKMFRSRNPLTYFNFLAGEEELINVEFFRKAKVVLCQSKIHSQIIQKNLFSNNIFNLGCNLFSDDVLKYLEKLLNAKKEKQYQYAIMYSRNPIKGTKQAIEYCQYNNINHYHFIDFKNQEQFLEELSKTENLIFFPQTLETYSRVFIEAKILGCKIITNKAIGVLSENYSNKSRNRTFGYY